MGLTYSAFDEEGELVENKISAKSKVLTIKPNEYIIVESIEVFELSDKVIAYIGSLSKLINQGLQLNYSPFIDPLYKGWLKVGIKNLGNKDVELKYGSNIGKLSFYDISDTYPIEMVKGSHQANLFSQRALDDGPAYPDHDDDSGLISK